MTRISSGAKKSGPPAHPNKFAFTHNRNSRLTKTILALPINGLCPSCRDVIEWRKRFRKYKPLSVPKRCVRCGERTVKEAYHVICQLCAVASSSCAKCLQSHTEGTAEKVGSTIQADQVASETMTNTRLDPDEAIIDDDNDDEGENRDGDEDDRTTTRKPSNLTTDTDPDEELTERA